MEKIKLVIYDLDSTLIDSKYLCTEVALRMMSYLKIENKLNLTHEDIYEIYSDPKRDLYKMVFDDFSYQYIHDLHTEMYSDMDGKIPAHTFPYVDKLIYNCKSSGLYIGIISNKESSLVRKDVNNLFPNTMDFVLGIDDFKIKKPNTSCIEMALDILCKNHGVRLDKNEILFVGDTENDIACAYNFGCKGILVNRKKDVAEELSKKYNNFDYFADIKGFYDFFKR